MDAKSGVAIGAERKLRRQFAAIFTYSKISFGSLYAVYIKQLKAMEVQLVLKFTKLVFQFNFLT